MNVAPLDALLLFTLSVPVVMGYRILPVDGTPYWLFGILFGLLIGNLVLSLHPLKLRKKFWQLKSLMTWLVLLIVLGGTAVTAMVDRSKTAPVYGVHDIVLQQEAAMRFLLEGKNPYRETYFGTPVEEFNYDELGNPDAVNPALYHFVMPPWYVLFPFITYAVSIPLFGFFDGRMALLVAMAGLLFVVWKWLKNGSLSLMAMTLTSLSPAVVDYFLEGRSDVFALFWLIWSLFFLERGRYIWSAVILALGIASKQTIWFAVPFYFVYLWAKHQAADRKKFILLVSVAAGGVLASVVGPFLAWDATAFFDSTVRYLNGTIPYGYPVGGYGLGMVLYAAGVIRDLHAYYPFVWWQALFGVPLLFVLGRWIMRKPKMSRVVLSYALFLSVVWYFSRYFNNSHFGYLSSVFALGALKALDEEWV